MCPLGIAIASLMFLVGANGEGMLYGTLPWCEAVKGQSTLNPKPSTMVETTRF